MTQPGWDLQILDAEGRVSSYLQLKATDSLGYVHEALSRYPDITILATDEVADRGGDFVLDSDITEASLEQQIGSAFDELDPGAVDRFLDAFSPLVPLMLIAASEGYRVVVGRTSMGHALGTASDRWTRSLLSSACGSAAYALAGGWVALPVAVASGLLYDRFRNQARIFESYERQIEKLTLLGGYQQLRLKGM
jgi:hypothetical protein